MTSRHEESEFAQRDGAGAAATALAGANRHALAGGSVSPAADDTERDRRVSVVAGPREGGGIVHGDELSAGVDDANSEHDQHGYDE